MSAKMDPGLWGQFFGDIEGWPKADTFYFTHDTDEGKALDQSIEVRFVDGSKCRISGTMRVILPTTEDKAISLTTQLGYKKYEDLEHRLILPVVRNALRLTANMMTARQSYSDGRPDFINWSWDQIQYGLYSTRDETKIVKDPITKEETIKTFKVIKRDENGNPIYKHNPLEGTGIKVANFEIKAFEYDDKVKDQIATQQENFMAVATARAQAEKAKAEEKRAEAEGKAAVMKAQYEEEEKKIKAGVEAQKTKEVAETLALRDKQVAVYQAEKRKHVATLDKQTAALTKAQQILLGQGEAERKRLVMAATNYLDQRLEAFKNAIDKFSTALENRQVPHIYMDGGNGNGKDQIAGYDADMLQTRVLMFGMMDKYLGDLMPTNKQQMVKNIQ